MLLETFFILALWSHVSPQVIMSVDFGHEFIKTAITKPGLPLETVLNRDSNRKTFNAIGFYGEERFIGDRALTVFRKSPSSVVMHPNFLLGKLFNSSAAELYRSRWPHVQLEQNERTGTINVRVDSVVFSIEKLVAMQLQDAKFFTRSFTHAKVSELVIGIPTYADQAVRQYWKKVANIVGISLNSLVESGVALGIRYAIAKRSTLPIQPQHVLIVDVGSYKTEAHYYECHQKITDQKKNVGHPVCEILGYGYYMEGIRTLDRCLFRILSKKFQENFGVEYHTVSSSRRDFIIQEEALTIKHSLTGITKTQFTLEQFYNDRDWHGTVSQDEVNAECKTEVVKPLEAIEIAKRSISKKINAFDSVVLMGGGSRVPLIQEEIKRLTNVDALSSVMNTDEDVALGSVFAGAGRSIHFRVAPIVCIRSTVYPITVTYVKSSSVDGEVTEKEVYAAMSKTEKGKVLTIKNQTNDFEILMKYGNINAEYSNIASPEKKLISNTKITGVVTALEENKEYAFSDVKIQIFTDECGIFKVKAVKAVLSRSEGKSRFERLKSRVSSIFGTKSLNDPEETAEFDQDKLERNKKPNLEKIEVNSPEEFIKQLNEKNAKELNTENTTTKSEEEPKINEYNKSEEEKNETKAEKVVLAENINVSLNLYNEIKHVALPSADDIDDSKSVLLKFRRQEIEKEKRERAKSEMESSIYDYRDKLSEGYFSEYASEDELKSLSQEVDIASSWFDEFGEDANTSDNEQAKKNLSLKFKFISDRKIEQKKVEVVVNDFEENVSKLDGFINMIKNDTNVSSLIDPKEFEQVVQEIDTLKDYLNVTKKEYATLKPWQEKTYPSLVLGELMRNITITTGKMSRIIMDYAAKVEKEMKMQTEKMKKSKSDADKKSKKDAADKSAESSEPNVEKEKPNMTENKSDEKEETDNKSAKGDETDNKSDQKDETDNKSAKGDDKDNQSDERNKTDNKSDESSEPNVQSFEL